MLLQVTGGNNGIGKEILLRLGQTDPEVTLICWGRDENRNQEVVKDLRAIGVSKVYAFNVDVTDVNQVSAAAEQVINFRKKWTEIDAKCLQDSE